MDNPQIICIGASMGGLERILAILQKTEDTTIPILVVQHVGRGGSESLALALSGQTNKSVHIAQDKMPIAPNSIYVAPEDYHTLVNFDGTFSLDASDRVSYARPSIDVSFASCSAVYGNTCIGVLVSGANTDGGEGMKAIKISGGMTLVENPELADYPQMPQSAIDCCAIDYKGSASALGEYLSDMSKEGARS